MAKLTPKHFQVLNALLTARSVRGAAELSGIHRSTIARYLDDPDFVGELVKRQDAALDAAAALLKKAGLDAALALWEDGNPETNPDAPSRIRANDLILSHGRAHVELLKNLKEFAELLAWKQSQEDAARAGVNGQHGAADAAATGPEQAPPG